MNALRAATLIGISLLAWAAPGQPPTPAVRHYMLTKVWKTGLGLEPFMPTWVAVCADGRTYVSTKSQRLVVLSPGGEILDDESGVPALQSVYSTACGPGDLLYAAGTHLVVLEWKGPGSLAVATDSPVPLLGVLQVAVAADGRALLRGYAKPGGSSMYVVTQDGTVLSPVGGAFERSPATMWGVSRATLLFDAKEQRFIEVPRDSYEFQTYSPVGKSSGTFRRNDPTFHPETPPADYFSRGSAGDLLPSAVALPGGGFVVEVVKRSMDDQGIVANHAEYFEVFDESFRPVARVLLPPGKSYGDLRGADRDGNLYLGPAGPGDIGIVKARMQGQPSGKSIPQPRSRGNQQRGF